MKDKVTISVESSDPKVLESVGILIKKGSQMVDGKLHTFVHVDDWEEFKIFLTTKYDETKALWGKNLKGGTVLPDGEIPVTRRSREFASDKCDQ